MAFDLREFIRNGVERSASADPHDIAAELSDQIPSNKVLEVVRELLPDAVREQIHKVRQSSGPASNGSPKWERVRNAARMESWREFIPGLGWTFLYDMTADQLDAAADYRESIARANEDKAKEYRVLADELRRTGAVTVRDLYEGAKV